MKKEKKKDGLEKRKITRIKEKPNVELEKNKNKKN